MDKQKLYAYRVIYKENYVNNRLRREWHGILVRLPWNEYGATVQMMSNVTAASNRLEAYKFKKQREQWDRERIETERRLKEMDEQETQLNNCAITL